MESINGSGWLAGWNEPLNQIVHYVDSYYCHGNIPLGLPPSRYRLRGLEGAEGWVQLAVIMVALRGRWMVVVYHPGLAW